MIDDRHLLAQSHLQITPALVELALERNGQQMVRQHAMGNPGASNPDDALEHLEGSLRAYAVLAEHGEARQRYWRLRPALCERRGKQGAQSDQCRTRTLAAKSRP